MTCEVAVMNKRGIALAADSAVTLSNGKRAFNTAEKLFPLSPSIPVAIMTFGAADIMSVPWETVIRLYAQSLGSRRFDTLDQYADELLNFVEQETVLFPSEDQTNNVKAVVETVWSDLYRNTLSKRLGNAADIPEKEKIAALAEIIHADHDVWRQYDDLEGFGPDYGARIVAAYRDVLNQVEKRVFVGMKLPGALKSELRKTVSLMFAKDWFHRKTESGLVIAGMGEAEIFPALIQYRVGSVAADRLRYAKVTEFRLGPTDDAAVVPFAQREIIDMIITGIHPHLRAKLVDDAPGQVLDAGANGKSAISRLTVAGKADFASRLHEETQQRHGEPFMEAVSGLPRQDLATLAETLVSLTIFLARMTGDKSQTVAAPIDVALLSKAGGFKWIKSKELT